MASMPVVEDRDVGTGVTPSFPEPDGGTSAVAAEHATTKHRNNAAIKNFKPYSPVT